MRREDCIVDCVGPDCEGCRNYKTRQMKDEIKDKILEILIDKIKATPHDYYPTGIEGLPQSARLIADMVQKFVEWLAYKSHGNFNSKFDLHKYWDVTTNEWRATFRKFDGLTWEDISIDDLFTFWFNNIKDK